VCRLLKARVPLEELESLRDRMRAVLEGSDDS
jgi:hypothetical protein